MVSMDFTIMPRPTCSGLTPPTSVVGFAAPERVCDSMSWNSVRRRLKPVVFTLAMLLPRTSILVWWLVRPDTPAHSERIMALLLRLRPADCLHLRHVVEQAVHEDLGEIATAHLVDHALHDLAARCDLDRLAQQAHRLTLREQGSDLRDLAHYVRHLLEARELRHLGDELLVLHRLGRGLGAAGGGGGFS